MKRTRISTNFDNDSDSLYTSKPQMSKKCWRNWQIYVPKKLNLQNQKRILYQNIKHILSCCGKQMHYTQSLVGMIYHFVVFCLFDLIPYVIVYNFSVMSGQVFLGWTSNKQRIKRLAQGPPVRLPLHWMTLSFGCVNWGSIIQNAYLKGSYSDHTLLVSNAIISVHNSSNSFLSFLDKQYHKR